MKKVFVNPVDYILNKIMFNIKIIGKADEKENEELCKKVSRTLSKVRERHTEEEIYSGDCQKGLCGEGF